MPCRKSVSPSKFTHPQGSLTAINKIDCCRILEIGKTSKSVP